MTMTSIQREHRTTAKNWGAENGLGKAAADELISTMEKQEAPTLLGHTIKSMINAGTCGGFEIGFFHRIAERLIYNV